MFLKIHQVPGNDVLQMLLDYRSHFSKNKLYPFLIGDAEEGQRGIGGIGNAGYFLEFGNSVLGGPFLHLHFGKTELAELRQGMLGVGGEEFVKFFNGFLAFAFFSKKLPRP